MGQHRPPKRPNPDQKRDMRAWRFSHTYLVNMGLYLSPRNSGTGRQRKVIRRGMGITRKPSSKRLPASVIIGRLS